MRRKLEEVSSLIFTYSRLKIIKKNEVKIITGIYAIKNEITQKYYIGQSININSRWNCHRYELNNNIHINQHLQNSWNKYGESNFSFSIIESCNAEDLDSREKYWISYFNSFKDGYNMDQGGQGTSGYKHTEEEISKMRRIQSPLVVLQFDTSFNFINRYEGGASHVKKVLKYTKDSITARCEHKRKNIIYKDSYWVYEDEYLSEQFSWEQFLKNISYFTPQKHNKNLKVSQKICQYFLNKELIKTWDTYKELEDSGFNRRPIRAICKKERNKKTYKGFIWAFEGYDFSDGYFDTNVKKVKNLGTEKRKRKIKQIDATNECIRVFNSIVEAAKEMNVNHSSISKALKNHSNCRGYKWEYV